MCQQVKKKKSKFDAELRLPSKLTTQFQQKIATEIKSSL